MKSAQQPRVNALWEVRLKSGQWEAFKVVAVFFGKAGRGDLVGLHGEFLSDGYRFNHGWPSANLRNPQNA